MNHSVTMQEAFDMLGTMGGEPIPDEDDGCVLEMAHQLAQEIHDQRGIDRGFGMKTKQPLNVIAGRGYAHGGNYGDFLMQAGTLVEDWCLSAGMPAAPYQGRHQESGFVDEHQIRFQARSVFFTFGQSSRTQRWISSSSRSIARRAGFWGLKPKPCNKRPT